ncbi:MAG: aspartyl/glutamyl-tRNA amidotransferase subunit C, partial [Chloroflexi bacterium]|nr:aspartyl/glutamyl-tRNA amidotransferase subunit C [Chloroflexota bacterium]
MANDGLQSPDLTLDDVRHLAMLARVATSDEDLEKMRGQLASILDSIRVLGDVDTDGVEPTAHAI